MRKFTLGKRQVTLFFKSVKRWQDLLGLGDWEITLQTNEAPLPPDYGTKMILREGTCLYDVEGRRATIAIRVNLPYPFPDEEIKKLAFHEVYHLVLADMNHMVCNSQLYDEEDADQECHRIIARMTYLLWEKSNR